MTEKPTLQQKVARALEDNNGVWFSTHGERIAVWCGGPMINLYNPRTWDHIGAFEVGAIYRLDDDQDKRDAVAVSLAKRGYVREGRGRDADHSKVTA